MIDSGFPPLVAAAASSLLAAVRLETMAIGGGAVLVYNLPARRALGRGPVQVHSSVGAGVGPEPA